MALHIRDFRQSDKAELSRLCETGRLIGALPRHAGGARPLSRATCSLPWWIWTFSRMNAQASCAGLYKPAAPPEHEAESSARDPSGRSHPGHSRSTRHLRTVGSAREARGARVRRRVPAPGLATDNQILSEPRRAGRQAGQTRAPARVDREESGPLQANMRCGSNLRAATTSNVAMGQVGSSRRVRGPAELSQSGHSVASSPRGRTDGMVAQGRAPYAFLVIYFQFDVLLYIVLLWSRSVECSIVHQTE